MLQSLFNENLSSSDIDAVIAYVEKNEMSKSKDLVNWMIDHLRELRNAVYLYEKNKLPKLKKPVKARLEVIQKRLKKYWGFFPDAKSMKGLFLNDVVLDLDKDKLFQGNAAFYEIVKQGSKIRIGLTLKQPLRERIDRELGDTNLKKIPHYQWVMYPGGPLDLQGAEKNNIVSLSSLKKGLRIVVFSKGKEIAEDFLKYQE